MEKPDATVEPLQHAGFWIRVAAWMIDLVAVAVPLAVFISFLSVAMGVSGDFLDLHPGTSPAELRQKFGAGFVYACLGFFVVTEWLYFALLESSRWRATLGKRFLGLYVGNVDGRRIDFWRASARFLFGRLLIHVPAVGEYYFLVDCACIGFTRQKRAIHDMAAGCLVLRESPQSYFVRGSGLER